MRREDQDYKKIMTEEGEELIYVGPLYLIDLPVDRVRRYQFTCALFTIAFLIVYVASCFIDPSSMYALYVTIPYGLMFVSACVLLGTAYRFSSKENPLKRAEYNSTVLPAWISSLAFSACSVVTTGMQGVFMLSAGATPRDVAFLCVMALLAVGSLVFLWIQKRVKTIKSEG